MSTQLVSEIVQYTNPAVRLDVDERSVNEVAASLRLQSKELRAKSESLRSRNLKVMKEANEVVGRYYDLVFRNF